MADDTVTKVKIKTAPGQGGEEIEVDAWFNPTQYVQNKQVAWQKHKNTEGDEPTLEFNAGEPMTMDLELMFDLFESGGDVKDEYVSKIQKMAHIDSALSHPPLVLFSWGSNEVFKGVITKMSATYNMFTPEGIATRAKVNLSFMRANELMSKEEAKEANKATPAGSTTTEGQRLESREQRDSAGGNVNERGVAPPGTNVSGGN
jgi:hypothetical protein